MCQACLSITISLSLLKLMFIESMMPSNHLIPCCPLLLPPLIFPSIRVFSHESALHIAWPKYWSFSFSISLSVQSLSHVQLFVTPWTTALQASLSITNSQNLLKLMSIELVMPSSHLILHHPLLLLPSIFPRRNPSPAFLLFTYSFFSESLLCIRWPKLCSFRFSISSSSEYSGWISFRIDWLDLAVQGTLKGLLQHHSLKG